MKSKMIVVLVMGLASTLVAGQDLTLEEGNPPPALGDPSNVVSDPMNASARQIRRIDWNEINP